MVRSGGAEETSDGSDDARGAVSRARPRRYKGVRMRKWGKWVAEIRRPNGRERIWLGSYVTAEEAGRAHDAAVSCLRGTSALLNYPDVPPDIPFLSDRGRVSASQVQMAAASHARGHGVAPPTETSTRTGVEPCSGRSPDVLQIAPESSGCGGEGISAFATEGCYFGTGHGAFGSYAFSLNPP